MTIQRRSLFVGLCLMSCLFTNSANALLSARLWSLADGTYILGSGALPSRGNVSIRPYDEDWRSLNIPLRNLSNTDREFLRLAAKIIPSQYGKPFVGNVISAYSDLLQKSAMVHYKFVKMYPDEADHLPLLELNKNLSDMLSDKDWIDERSNSGIRDTAKRKAFQDRLNKYLSEAKKIVSRYEKRLYIVQSVAEEHQRKLQELKQIQQENSMRNRVGSLERKVD